MKRWRENKYLPPYEKHHDSPGIYLISMPQVSRLVYIGSAAQTIRHRWRQHLSDLLARRHGNSLLQRAVNKYGVDKLQFEILELCATEEVLEREQDWLGRYEWDNLFNLNPIAASRLGTKLSKEDRLKLAESHGGISSPKILKRIAAEYRQGSSQVALAKKYKVDRASIRNYLLRLGVCVRPRVSQHHAIVAKVKNLYRQGLSSAKVAKEVEIDQGTVIRILKDAGAVRSVSEAQKIRAKSIDRRRYARAAGAHIDEFQHPKHGTFQGYQFEFRRKFNLSETLVSQLCRGLRKEVNGWKLASRPRKTKSRTRGGKTHHFIHPKHGEFVGRQKDLLERFSGLTQASVSGLVRGSSVSHKGWEIKKSGSPHVFRGGSTNTRTGEPRKLRRKIPVEDYPQIKRALAAGAGQAVVAARYNVHQATISNLCKRRGWSNVKATPES
jgi:group I intron endonuclease